MAAKVGMKPLLWDLGLTAKGGGIKTSHVTETMKRREEDEETGDIQNYFSLQQEQTCCMENQAINH